MSDTPSHRDKPAPKTLEEMNAAQIGNEIMAPLINGLMVGHSNHLLGTIKRPAAQVLLGDALNREYTFVRPGLIGHVTYNRPRTSALTTAVADIHQQLVDIARHTGELIDTKRLPQKTVEHMYSFDTPEQYVGTKLTRPYRPFVENREPDYATKLIGELSPDQLKEIPLDMVVDGKPVSIPNVMIAVPNIHMGRDKRNPIRAPLAQAMYAMALAGEMLLLRGRAGNPEHAHFISSAIPGLGVYALPPAQAIIHRTLVDELKKKGYKNPEKLLSDKQCDFNRPKLRVQLENLLPYAEIYQTATQLRGLKTDTVNKALARVKSALGKAADAPGCSDRYECAVLLEGMIDYAVANSTGKEQDELKQLKLDFVNEVGRNLLRFNADKPEGTPVEQLLAHPLSLQAVEAFSHTFAAQSYRDQNTDTAQTAWAILSRSKPGPTQR